MAELFLPEDRTKLAEVMEHLTSAARDHLNIKKVTWLLSSLYLQGVRDFVRLDYGEGTVQANYRNLQGEMYYRHERIVRRFVDELGRRSRFDPRPVVEKGAVYSLDGLRRASSAQAALNAMATDVDLERVKARAIEVQCLFGSGALVVGTVPGDEGRAKITLTVVPPWQVVSVPIRSVSPDSPGGVMRLRTVELAWLKDQNLKSPPNGWKSLKTRRVTLGDDANDLREDHSSPQNIGRSGDSAGPQDQTLSDGSGGTRPRPLESEVVDLAELWCEYEDGTLKQFTVWAGGAVLKDERWERGDDRPVSPVCPFVDVSVGAFHGRSFVELLIPTNWEAEHLLKNTFENFADLDAFGFLMVPNTMGVRREDFKASGKPRVIFYEPDLTVPEHRPFNLSPANLGDAPAKVAMLAQKLMDDLAGQPTEMTQGAAPGRVDSAQALGFLWETGNTSLVGPMQSLAQAFVRAYRAMLSIANRTWTPTTVVHLTGLDDHIVGVSLDPGSQQVLLDKSPVPHPNKVVIKVQSQLPRSIQQRKAELLDMLQRQLVSPRQFVRISVLEGLDFPVIPGAEFESYRKAMLANIVLFGDGQTPGKFQGSSSADIPEVHLEATQAFMARPEFALASVSVRRAFEQRRDFYLQQMGQYLPPGVGHPEEEAQNAMSLEALGEGMGGMEEGMPGLPGMEGIAEGVPSGGMGGPEPR